MSGLESSLKINKDAFSHSQIKSKLWLCEHLERIINEEKAIGNEKARILIHGGWYGLLSFVLRVRENIDIEHITSIDVVYDSSVIANQINETWVNEKVSNWHRGFQAITQDSNKWQYHHGLIGDYSIDIPHSDISVENVIINTSTEHFKNDEWFKNIPDGRLIALQSTDMTHPTHINTVKGLHDMKKRFPMSKYYFKGSKFFAYSKIKKFYRFMLIGMK